METNKTTLYSSCLLLYVAKADEKLERCRDVRSS